MTGPRIDSSWRGPAPARAGGVARKLPAALAAPAATSKPRPLGRPKGLFAPPSASGSAGTRANYRSPYSNPAFESQSPEELRRRERRATENVINPPPKNAYGQVSSGPNNVFTRTRTSTPGQQREMTQNDYDALTPQARAAVDFNGMLSRAISQDKSEDLLKLDKDRSGTVSIREATEGGADTESYRSALRKIFKREPTDDDTFAPATLGLINQLELSDELGTVDEYLSGSAFVTEKDLKASGARGAVQGPMIRTADRNQQSRDNLVEKVATGMANLEQTLQGGKVVVGGVGLTPSVRGIDNSQRDELVRTMSEALLADDRITTLGMRGQGWRYDPASGVNVSSLLNQDEAQRMLDYENVFQQALDNGWTELDLKDRSALKQLGFTEATGIKLDEWADYVNRREATANEFGRTLEQDKLDQIATDVLGTGG